MILPKCHLQLYNINVPNANWPLEDRRTRAGDETDITS
jgi:hypothetical protein